MSALEAGPVTAPAPDPRVRPTVKAVAAPTPRIRRVPFLLLLAGILGVGMIGLLVLNTTLQSQAFESRTLNQQAALLTNQQAQWQTRVDGLRTPATLVHKALQLGMVPNPRPAYVTVPQGKILGKPHKVSASLPSWIAKTAGEIRAAKAESARLTAQAQAQAQAQARQAAQKANPSGKPSGRPSPAPSRPAGTGGGG